MPEELFNNKNHIINYPDKLLEFIRNNIRSNLEDEKFRPKSIKFKIRAYHNSFSVVVIHALEEIVWLKTREVYKILKKFRSVDIDAIDKIVIGYVMGMYSPMINNTTKTIAHSGDYYQVFIRIKYKN